MNLVTDGLPAVALARDPASRGRCGASRDRRDACSGASSSSRSVLAGVTIGLAATAAYLAGRELAPEAAQTMAFATIALAELLFVFSTRPQGRPPGAARGTLPSWRASCFRPPWWRSSSTSHPCRPPSGRCRWEPASSARARPRRAADSPRRADEGPSPAQRGRTTRRLLLGIQSIADRSAATEALSRPRTFLARSATAEVMWRSPTRPRAARR